MAAFRLATVRRLVARPILLGLLVLCGSARATLAQTASITNLGTLWNVPIAAHAVNDGGTVVVGHVFVNGDFRAVRWTPNGGAVDLGGLPNGWRARATGVSNDGNVISGLATLNGASPYHGVMWAGGAAAVDLGTVGGIESEMLGVSADGSVLVGSSLTIGGLRRAIRWSAAGLENLGVLPGRSVSFATAVNHDGSVVVGVCDYDTAQRGFRWQRSTGMVDIGAVAGGTATFVADVSANGNSMTGFCRTPQGFRAFLWTATGGMRNLGTGPEGIYTVGDAISGDGYFVAGHAGNFAMFWTERTGIVDLAAHLTSLGVSLTDWTRLIDVSAVNIDGTVLVGRGVRSGHQQGFLIRMPAVPRQSCRADVNADGTVSVQDLFDFLAAYFRSAPGGDFDQSGSISPEDIFAFLAAYSMRCF